MSGMTSVEVDDLRTRVRDTRGMSLADLAADKSDATDLDCILDVGLPQARFNSAI